jgi:general secretion pathway protein G
MTQLQTSHEHRRRTTRRQLRGFTLIEIMVVVVIIGLLAALVVPNLMGRVGQASVTKAKADVQAIETALTMYKLDNFSYPNSSGGLQALVQKPSDDTAPNWKSGGYLKRVPKDPWGNDYQYTLPGTHGSEFDLYSLGADKQEGGEGENADIGNWNLDQNPSQ